MSSKKIWQYPEATSITNDDYILMDSNTETGSQCLKANKIGAVHITKTVTERKVYKASDDNANGFSEVTVAVPYTDVHYDKDDIVSFIGEDLPLKSVTAYIKPQQDLHGYDAPWVGGGGKNKVDVASGSTTATVTLIQKELNAGTYTYSVYGKRNDGEHWRVAIASQEDETIAAGNDTSGTTLLRSQVTFTLTETTTIRLKLQFLSSYDTLNYERVQLEVGSTATSFAPYSNICPISGWSAVDVSVSGVNVWDEEWEVGGLNPLNGETTSENDRIRSKNYRPCKPNMTMFYYIPSNKGNLQIVFYDINKNYLGYYNFTTEHTFTTPNGCFFFKFNTGGSYGTTYNNDISINYPSTDTEYHAYNGHTYTIDLDGTRYGGTLDVVSGVLTLTHGYIASYNGETLPSTWISDRDVYAEGTTPTIGAEVCYELATPTTIQLTPTQVSSLLGVNNVWADCGEIAVEWQTLYVTPTT